MKKQNVMTVVNGYAGGYRYLIMTGRLLAAVSALVALVPYYQIWKIIKVAIDGTNLSEIKTVAWHAVITTIIAMLLYVAALMCNHKSAFRVQANMRTKLMEQIIRLPLGVFDKEGTGKIRRIVMESTAATETYIAHNIADKAVATVTPLGIAVLFLVFDWKIGLMCLVPAVLGFVCMVGMRGKEMETKMAEYQNALENMSNEAVEYVRGIPVVKTFGQSVHSFKRFKGAIDNYGKWTVDYTVSLRKAMIGFMTFINATFVSIIVAAYIFAGNGVTSDLILNIMYYIIITPILTVTLTKIAYSGEAEMTLMDSMRRIDDILTMEPLSDAKNTHKVTDNSITLKNVTYRYKDATKDAVHGLSLRINAGEHVAFVGPSGGGKTTVSRLMVRFWDATKGSIKVGGMDVSKVDPETLLSMYSIVFQDVTLFNNSVMENIRIGKKNATDEEVIEAAKLANCHEFIQKLPEGYKTNIGENGSNLSGGERQRLSIARAFLKDAPIILLDEATASLDVENETMIQQALSRLIKDKTVIIIAHRMRTIANADKIVVLKDGTVAECGSPSKLVNENGIYKHMIERQLVSEKWKV